MDDLRALLMASDKIVFFGGAGVSTESDIPDFRSEAGIYKTISRFQAPPEEILSHHFFIEKTGIFYDFYKSTMIYPSARPNKAHLALAELENMGKLQAVITQNIDGLHQLAGSKTVYELHGSVQRNYCMKCQKHFDLDYMMNSTDIPVCDKCGGIVKPDVVLYEESLDEKCMRDSVAAIRRADLLIVGGTSLNVYPAAGLIQYFQGSKLILINKEETPYDRNADLIIRGPIGEILGEALLMRDNGV